MENIAHYEEALERNNIPKAIVEKSVKQFDAQKSFNVDDAAKKAVSRIAEIDRKISALKEKNKDLDIER